MITFEDIKPRSKLSGVDTSGVITVVSSERYGEQAIKIIFEAKIVHWWCLRKLDPRKNPNCVGFSQRYVTEFRQCVLSWNVV